jgi:hypothetical protein
MVDITQDPTAASDYDFIIKQNATQPSLEFSLSDQTDTPINLTDASIEFRMKQPEADSLHVNDAATVVDASNGIARYNWSAADTSEAGYFNAEIAVDFSGQTGDSFGADEFFPVNGFFSVLVTENLTG